MKGSRKNIHKNFEFLNNQNIDKYTKLTGIFTLEDYTIGEISTDENWPRLIQGIKF